MKYCALSNYMEDLVASLNKKVKMTSTEGKKELQNLECDINDETDSTCLDITTTLGRGKCVVTL